MVGIFLQKQDCETSWKTRLQSHLKGLQFSPPGHNPNIYYAKPHGSAVIRWGKTMCVALMEITLGMDPTIMTFPPNELLFRKVFVTFPVTNGNFSVASHQTQSFLPHVTFRPNAAKILTSKDGGVLLCQRSEKDIILNVIPCSMAQPCKDKTISS